jgi:hypothetical protein
MTTQTVQALDVQGLEKSYKKLEVLRGVDFEVARGSIFALLGPNGAGPRAGCRPRRGSGPASGPRGAAAASRRAAGPCAAPSQPTLRRGAEEACGEWGSTATSDGRTWTRLAAMNPSTSAGSGRTCRPTFT